MPVQGALYASAALIEYMGVDHGSLDTGVPQQLLEGADIVAVLQQVGGERVSESVACGTLLDSGTAHGHRDLARYRAFVQVKTPTVVRAWIFPMIDDGKMYCQTQSVLAAGSLRLRACGRVPLRFPASN